MHELGIIVHVMRTVEDVAAENNLTEIRSVTCEIGEVSGVVPEYMTDCWGYARTTPERLAAFAQLMYEVSENGSICVIGSKRQIESCGEEIDSICIL